MYFCAYIHINIYWKLLVLLLWFSVHCCSLTVLLCFKSPPVTGWTCPKATHCGHLPGVVGERPQVFNCQGLSLLSHSLTVCLSPLPLFTCYAVRLSCVPGLVSQHHHVVSQYAIPTEYRRWTPQQGDWPACGSGTKVGGAAIWCWVGCVHM